MLQASLSNRIEMAHPEWRDKFLSYKKLNKSLKLIRSNADPTDTKRQENPPKPILTPEEEDFTNLLAAEIHKSNVFFLDKEEEYIIRQKELQHRVTVAEDSEEQQIQVRKEILQLHEEIVLFLDFCAINSTGLEKLMKKIDKRTQVLVRHPFIQKLLQQPLFTIHLLCKVEEDCRLFNYGVGIHLIQCDKAKDMPVKAEMDPKDSHISFQCESIALVEKRLKEMGIAYLQSCVEEGGVQVDQLFFHDPDGFMIEICNCDNLPVVPLAAVNGDTAMPAACKRVWACEGGTEPRISCS